MPMLIATRFVTPAARRGSDILATPGITWNAVAGGVAGNGVLGRRRLLAATAAAAMLGTAAAGAAAAIHRDLVPRSVIGSGLSPWFADPNVGPDGSPTLPSLDAVEQVVGAQQAWASGGTGSGVDVAVLDSGVTPVPGLDAPGKVINGPDLSFDSQNPNLASLDAYGHGTAMASIIAGNDGTAGGFRGVAPDARIVNVKIGAANGAVDVSQIIAGIDWVTRHAHDRGLNIRVLNISLGTDSTQSYVLDPLAHAAEVAWRHGIVVVAAVGNGGAAAGAVADPAIDPFVLAVGAEDPKGTIATGDDVVAPFSSVGTSLRHADLVAPGSSIVALRDPGSYLDSSYPAAQVGDRFFRGSGTSQAAAIVSGAVADVLSARPSLTPDRVKSVLTGTAVAIATSDVNAVGAGLLNLAGAVSAKVEPRWVQTAVPSSGRGSLEAARGSAHVTLGGVALTGEQDIFGNAWDATTMAAAEDSRRAWDGGVFNGATWSGATWSGATWSGATWSGATWSGATWSGATWSGATWSGATWSGATWSGATWSGATWSGATWSGSTWSGDNWE
jgi:serine protease AprX